MEHFRIIDTFGDYLAFWEGARDKPIDEQIQVWEAVYMANWPELLAAQKNDYAEQGEDWRQIAHRMVFPSLGERLDDMVQAHHYLLAESAGVFEKARDTLSFEGDLIIVIYVGIGCGAGWVTKYEGRPAILFGLENIAECSWTKPPAITGLIAHEMGHVIHFDLRERADLKLGSDPWSQLYSEGYAMHCEQLLTGDDSWHMRSYSQTADWLAWCRANESRLAKEFVVAADNGQSVRQFFGSWHDIDGYKQTGYYLGARALKLLQAENSLVELALLEGAEYGMRRPLEILSGQTSASGSG